MNTGDILLTIGVPASIKGYKFIVYAVEESRKRPELLEAITKELYPAVAERFNTTASKAERAMRHAIDVADKRGGFLKLNGILGIDIFTKNDKPTNGEFLALLTNHKPVEKPKPEPKRTPAEETRALIGKLSEAAMRLLDDGDVDGAMKIAATINDLKAG
jgi:hypothetical protein